MLTVTHKNKKKYAYRYIVVCDVSRSRIVQIKAQKNLVSTP